jgi:hypothetical protein
MHSSQSPITGGNLFFKQRATQAIISSGNTGILAGQEKAFQGEILVQQAGSLKNSRTHLGTNLSQRKGVRPGLKPLSRGSGVQWYLNT